MRRQPPPSVAQPVTVCGVLVAVVATVTSSWSHSENAERISSAIASGSCSFVHAVDGNDTVTVTVVMGSVEDGPWPAPAPLVLPGEADLGAALAAYLQSVPDGWVSLHVISD